MMDIDADARRQYEQAGARVAPAQPVTLLRIGEQQTTAVCGTGARPTSLLHLAIGYAKTAHAFFKHLPPTPDEMELAIMTVEDEVIGIRHDLPAASALFSSDAALSEIAQISGIKEQAGGWLLPLDDLERTFKRLERVMLGAPAAWEGIPLDNSFAARLLILREFMHHHGFEAIHILAPCPSAG
ncbi:hypothetical protein [Brenneria tiliae]